MHKDILIFLDNKMYRIVEHLNIRVLEYSGNGNIILISRVYNNTPILITPLNLEIATEIVCSSPNNLPIAFEQGEYQSIAKAKNKERAAKK